MTGQPENAYWFDIVLPLGISFHTFQSISYVVDVYRGQQKAVRNPIDYALFICFFPQLVAGPIVRARDFFRDLLDWRPPSGDRRIARAPAAGAGPDEEDGASPTSSPRWPTPISETYAANSGDADSMVRSVRLRDADLFRFFGLYGHGDRDGQLFGFHFPANFRRPYLASSITEFWRRWHISLSTWLRDYLYIPLGGNRYGRWQTYRNLMLTMLLGGLWHGASWNFVIWGGYQGALLSIERAFRGDVPSEQAKGWLYPPKAILTFGLALVGWVFFRAADLPQSLAVLRQMFSGAPGHILLEPWQVGLAGVSLIVALWEEHFEFVERLAKAPVLAYASGLALMFMFLEIFGSFDVEIPFIYFQF